MFIILTLLYYIFFKMINLDQKDQINDKILKEIKEFGFEEEKILLAMKFSSEKEEIINLIMRMLEDNEFYLQMKQATLLPQDSNSTQLISSNNMLGAFDHYKMVIIVREDLNMSKGKCSAQVGHAVLGAYKESVKKNPAVVNGWECYSGQAKIVLGCKDEKELLELKKKAEDNGLITSIVRDAGRTEVDPGTITCCAIGPGIVSKIDVVTGKLNLLK